MAKIVAHDFHSDDLYKRLGLTSRAPAALIEEKYQKFSARHQPSINGSPQAADILTKLDEAYEVLSHKDKRAHYDLFQDIDGARGFGGSAAEAQALASAQNIVPRIQNAQSAHGGGFWREFTEGSRGAKNKALNVLEDTAEVLTKTRKATGRVLGSVALVLTAPVLAATFGPALLKKIQKNPMAPDQLPRDDDAPLSFSNPRADVGSIAVVPTTPQQQQGSWVDMIPPLDNNTILR